MRATIDWLVADIIDLFKNRFFFTMESLMEELNVNNSIIYPKIQVYAALTSIIDNNTPMTDMFGREGTLTNIHHYYMFQPKHVDASGLSLFDRTVPYELPPHDVKMDDLPNVAPSLQLLTNTDIKSLIGRIIVNTDVGGAATTMSPIEISPVDPQRHFKDEINKHNEWVSKLRVCANVAIDIITQSGAIQTEHARIFLKECVCGHFFDMISQNSYAALVSFLVDYKKSTDDPATEDPAIALRDYMSKYLTYTDENNVDCIIVETLYEPKKNLSGVKVGEIDVHVQSIRSSPAYEQTFGPATQQQLAWLDKNIGVSSTDNLSPPSVAGGVVDRVFKMIGDVRLSNDGTVSTSYTHGEINEIYATQLQWKNPNRDAKPNRGNKGRANINNEDTDVANCTNKKNTVLLECVMRMMQLYAESQRDTRAWFLNQFKMRHKIMYLNPIARMLNATNTLKKEAHNPGQCRRGRKRQKVQ